MNNWTKISNEYKDTKLMEEFQWYRAPSAKANIEDVWGHLIVFAQETEKAVLMIHSSGRGSEFYNYPEIYDIDKGKSTFDKKSDGSTKTAMLWCADKFFKEIK